MDAQVTSAQIRTAGEVLALLQVLLQEDEQEGGDLLIRVLEGMQKDLQTYISRGTVEMKIGDKGYQVSKEVAGIVSQVGILADKWREDFGDDFLPAAVGLLEQWLAMFRQRTPVNLTVISPQTGTVAISAPGLSRQVMHISAVLLALISLGLATKRLHHQMEKGGEVRLMPT